MDTEQLKHDFWNEQFAKLNRINSKVENICDTKEHFIQRLDEIAVENHVTSFGYTEYSGAYASVRATMELNLETGNHFDLEISANASPKTNEIKGAYLELNLLHQNGKEFLSNTVLPFLPYTAIESLLKTLPHIEDNYSEKLLEKKKQYKSDQVTFSLIRSLLVTKFKNSIFSWEISRVGDGAYLVLIRDGEKQVHRFFVDEKNCVENIMSIKL